MASILERAVDATSVKPRVKVLVWGDSGVGKTWLGLGFPKPFVVDFEHGAEPYLNRIDSEGKKLFDFKCLSLNEAQELHDVVNELLTTKHDFRTLVINPITMYWSLLQDKWIKILGEATDRSSKGKHGDEKKGEVRFYELQPGDWRLVTGDHDEMMMMLKQLDMNIFCTCRAKTKYKDNSFMVADGVTFDGQKSLEYWFDTVIHLFVKNGKHLAICTKDRTGNIPMHVEFTPDYSYFAKAFGAEAIQRESEAVVFITEEQKKQITDFIANGVITATKFNEALPRYGVKRIDRLTQTDAAIIITKLEELQEKKRSRNGS